MPIKYFLNIVTICLLVSCAGLPDREVPVEDVGVSSSQPEMLQIPTRKSQSGSSAVDKLLNDANDAMAAQLYNKAAALMERAIRVAPQDGRTYFALAQVHYYQNNLALSRSFLQKANALAVNDKKLSMSIERFSHLLGSLP